MTDAMVELLVETVHKIGTRSKRKVVGDIAKDGSTKRNDCSLILPPYRLTIPTVVFAMSSFRLSVKKSWRRSSRKAMPGARSRRRIYAVMRNSWANHYRRMLPSLLSVLEFRSNNAVWRPVLSALDWIRAKQDDGCRFVPQQDVPTEGLIPAKWGSSVIDGNGRVNRISYELCVLTQLRECIRSKEIWVVGANRYRNPDDDLPKDFAVRRSSPKGQHSMLKHRLWKICESALDIKLKNPSQKWSPLPLAVCRYPSVEPLPSPVEMEIDRLSCIKFGAAHHRG